MRRVPNDSPADTAVLVVPIRAFSYGNERLAGHLEDTARAELAQRMADTVIDAGGELATVVVTSAPEVASWATERGASLLEDPGTLDAAADAGRRWALAHGYRRAIVAHADLASVRSFHTMAVHAGVDIITLVPDHRGDGTPVLSLPTNLEFVFSYGPDSFRRHCAEVARLGAGLRVLRRHDLMFDIDLPADLEQLSARSR